MKSTRIFVVKLKEIIYAAIFALLGILLIMLLIFMFTNKKKEATPTFGYNPGVWTSPVTLDDQQFSVEVIVDKDNIKSIKLRDLSESTETLYQLLVPAMSSIESQMVNDISFNELDVNSDYKHTSKLLLDAVEKALDKAKIDDVHNN